jgi:L-fuconolactonase
VESAAGVPDVAVSAPIVDAHVHVWTKDPRYPWARETKNPPDREATAEMLLDLMQANGVQKTVIIQVIHYRWDNRYVADVLKKYPQYFRGVARVNPEDPAAPDHLSKLTEVDGFHGVRLSPGGDPSGDWIRGPLMPPLWQRCRDLKVPMTILAPIARMPDVAKLAERFPDLTIVIDHMADNPPSRTKELEQLLVLRRFPKLFVKVSHSWALSTQPYPYPDAQEQIRRLYDVFGPKRLIAGTDWPLVERYCTYAQAVDFARSHVAFLNAEDKRWICGLTAMQVWPFDSVTKPDGDAGHA